MTQEKAKQLMPIITAWADGKTMQFKTHRGWEDIAHLADIEFRFGVDQYRIKPEPREWHLKVAVAGNCIHAVGDAIGATCSKTPRREPTATDGWEYVRAREIID